ncbi:unannotated protein [freshwater metagenome]|uniref:Unannotated protein n=1 Tax=freshwater metagenome TaxID=449393 RepID=A0A6J6IRL0_9ZZZZ
MDVGRTSAPVPTITSDVVSSAGGVPDGAEIDGASPAFAVTTGRADAEPDEVDEPAESEISESDIPESDMEVTPKNMAPTIVKTRATARTVRNDFFMGGSLPFSF